MRIEVKNFKYYPSLSEETHCFQANLWVNGVKCGTTENRGIGGATDYHHDNTDRSRQLIMEAEAYCLTLPPITWNSNGKDYELSMNLERYIDEAIVVLVKKKEDEANTKKLRKDMQTAILIGDENSYRMIGFKKPLKDIWQQHPEYFKKTLKEKLEQYADKNYKLLNTNIPLQFLN